MLGPLPKVKAQNNTKAKKGTDMTHSRRNQSPLITMNSMQDNQTSTQASIYAQQFHNSGPGRADPVKQSKTRNNLQ